MRGFLRGLVGLLQWTLAIGSVLGTLALFTWILVMVLRKDQR